MVPYHPAVRDYTLSFGLLVRTILGYRDRRDFYIYTIFLFIMLFNARMSEVYLIVAAFLICMEKWCF